LKAAARDADIGEKQKRQAAATRRQRAAFNACEAEESGSRRQEADGSSRRAKRNDAYVPLSCWSTAGVPPASRRPRPERRAQTPRYTNRGEGVKANKSPELGMHRRADTSALSITGTERSCGHTTQRGEPREQNGGTGKHQQEAAHRLESRMAGRELEICAPWRWAVLLPRGRSCAPTRQ
jgi:hypothetical protein